MKIQLLQSQVGKFNLFGNEETFSFSLCLKENDQVVERDGVKAILYYSGEADEKCEFDNYMEDMDIGSIFAKAFGYAKRICSTRDYMSEALLFAKLYRTHYEVIKDNWQKQNDKDVLAQIERLQKLVGQTPYGLELDNFLDVFCENIAGEAEKYARWIKANSEKLKELKEDSSTALNLIKQNEEYGIKQAALLELLI